MMRDFEKARRIWMSLIDGDTAISYFANVEITQEFNAVTERYSIQTPWWHNRSPSGVYEELLKP